MNLEWLGYLAATCTTVAFIPQAAKTIRKLGGTETSVLTVGGGLLEEHTTVVKIVVG